MEQRTITVRASGKASGKPDLLHLPLTLTAKDMEYERAAALAASRYDALKEALLAAGLGASSITTANYSVDTSYESERDDEGNYKTRFDGYVCTHQLKLEFDLDMALLGRVLQGVAQSAADPSYSIRFGVKDAEALVASALIAAQKSARLRAEALAAASGASLGELISIDHTAADANAFSQTSASYTMRAYKADAAAVELNPDDVTLCETAAFVWSIK